MRTLISAILLLMTLQSLSQTRRQLYIDSVSIALSNYLDSNQEHLDSADLMAFMKEAPFRFQGAMDTISSGQEQQVAVELIIRLMHHNTFFSEKMYAKVPESKYWKHVTSMPPSSISREDCASFWEYHKFTYHDTDTSQVSLTIDNGYWIDHMPDSTFSKLSLQKINDQIFNICFIESNNFMKSQISMPGDVYCYQLLEKTDHSFKLSMHIQGLSSYDIFELEY